MEDISHIKRRELLTALIEEWNANRLDLFEISLPDENLEYHGVMRFLFQDAGAKLATKCIRVASSANTQNVIETLVEKFRPDMKMLTTPIYHLYEVDSNGAERRLDLSEYPLEVQLNWTRDEKEGKFVLRNAAHKPINVQKADKNESSFKRKLSKREKKEQKKRQEKGGDEDKENDEEPSGVFVRTKSNSEAVMKRRRELKVQKKLDEIQKEGDHGGLLKIHGDSLNPGVPYKSLLLSATDTAAYVVKEMLDKYGINKAASADYCLVQVFNANAGEIGGGLRPQEHILQDDECPLAILQHQVNRGNVTFDVRRRDGKRTTSEDKGIPFLLELNLDGSDIMKPMKHLLHTNLTEVGSIAQPSSGQHLRMIGPTIEPHHAVIANIEGVVTVTPIAPEAECYVEGKRIFETTVLKHGKVVRFGHHHAFRFFDPSEDEVRKRNMPEGVDGVENGTLGYSPRMDDVLPAGLEFRDEGEDGFLFSVITEVTEGICQFKLAPCYTVYLACRYRVDRLQQGMSLDEHLHKLLMFCNKVSYLIRDCVNRHKGSPQELAFWMANMSELLHFFKMDKDLQKQSQQAQNVLASTVQDAFKELVYIMQGDLYSSMPAFLAEGDSDVEAGEVLHVLSSAMSLLRRCRVNAALTIQLFSQLFHFINMWLFNKLVMEPHLGLITRQWGVRLKRRLHRVEAWAEKQGLELAADCHLCRISQAAHLLQAPKHSADDIASISSLCFKLNSVQLRALLEQYKPEPGEMPQVPQNVIESVVSVARSTADDLTRSEGREVTLNEDADLQLPFLLPEDGYSSDIIKGVPQGLADFLEPAMGDGLCRLTPLPTPTGSWQVFMNELDEDSQEDDTMLPPGQPALPNVPDSHGDGRQPPLVDVDGHMHLPAEPEIIHIQLHKVKGSMGLSIVAAKGESQVEKGIYVKSVVTGGAADQDGNLKAGDQLLEVDSKSLVGLTQERAADLMKDTGQVVDLVVVKQGAIYHGLATLLNQPTPPMSRPSGHPLTAQDNPSYMVQSKSTPMLNDDSYDRSLPGFGGGAAEDMRSKSQGNLMREDERGRWQQQSTISPPGDNRADADSPNYQNLPENLAHGQRSAPHYRDGGNGPGPMPAGQMTNRPRSEFVDPNWYPPPPDDRHQPIYQNHQIGKPRPGYDDRELPSPPGNERPPPVPPHPSEEDQLPLPPPPSSDYMNYQIGSVPPPKPSQPSMSQQRPRMDAPSDPRYTRPDQRGPPEAPRAAAEPPPWARGPQRPPGPVPGAGPVRGGPPSPRSPTSQQPARPGFHPQGSRPLQPGDLMRGPPVIQPYRPPVPGDSYRGPPVRGPQPMDPYRAPGPRQPIRPVSNQVYQSQPMRMQRPPPANQQMPPNQMNHNTMSKDGESRRMSDDRRIAREDSIRDLESKPYRSTEEEERLGRLRLDSEFERRAEMARNESEDDGSMNRPYASGPMLPNRGYQQPPPPQLQGIRRAGLPAHSQAPPTSQVDSASSVKRDMLQSKTVTFKPAYRGDETIRPGDFSKHTLKQDDNRAPDFQRNQRELREKQRRDAQDSRRPFHHQDSDRMMNQGRYGAEPGPMPAQPVQHRPPGPPGPAYGPGGPAPAGPPGPQRDYQPSYDRNVRMSQSNMYRPDDVGNRASYTPPQSTQPPPQSNRFSQPSYNNSSFAGPQPYRPTSEVFSNYRSSSPPNSYAASNASYGNSQLMQQQHTPAQDPSMLADTELSSGNTPGVIGAQEVYRDPRSRIEAEQRSQKPKGEAGDRLSFRDKMKMFAAEAGENTPIQRPKLSKSQRALEESLAYGNGHIP